MNSHTVRDATLPTRRSALKAGLVTAIAATSFARSAFAASETFPSKPVRIIVGYPPGQTVDATARVYAQALAEHWKKPVYVENMPGANGILAARNLKSAAADGHTLMFGTSGQLAINLASYTKPGYDTMKDFVPLAIGAKGRLYLVVNDDLPVKTLPELIAYVKAHPKSVSYGSGGAGITANLAMELLKAKTGMDMLHVPFKGSSAAITGLIGNNVQAMFDAGSLVIPQVKSGKIRAIAVSSLGRADALPDVHTVDEQGVKGFDVASWSALVGPAAIPHDIALNINDAMVNAAKSASVQKSMATIGSDPFPLNLADTRAFFLKEIPLWAQAVKAAGIEPM